LSSSLASNSTSSPHLPPTSIPSSFTIFSPTSQDEVRRAILMSSNATCSLDTIPAFLFKSCLDSLITPITNIMNLSLLEAPFPSSFKNALVRSRLKNIIYPMKIYLVIDLHWVDYVFQTRNDYVFQSTYFKS